jgi:hypothetical protein
VDTGVRGPALVATLQQQQLVADDQSTFDVEFCELGE